MRLGNERESGNVEDRRGRGRGGLAIGGGLGGVLLLVLGLVFGVDLGPLIGTSGLGPTPQQTERPAADDAGRRFVAQVLGSTEDVWTDLFARTGRSYAAPTLVLFSGITNSGCGTAQSTMGPFYCPADSRVYIDLEFLADMQRKLGANGDFAAAYVIAHEVGHHVQNQLGVLERASGGNAAKVRVELMADCFAGVWASRSRRLLDAGDIEEGLNAAAAVGDDRLQRRAQGTVVPESFTHGSSAQRVQWFRRGLDRGEPAACDTFAER